LFGFAALLGRDGERDVQLSNQMAERAKKKIQGRTSNKFVSTFPVFMWQAEKREPFRWLVESQKAAAQMQTL